MKQELLDEPVGLISTDLGGDGERLRYIFVLALQGQAPEKQWYQEMRKVLNKVCQRYSSAVEQVRFRTSCLIVQVFVPLDVAVGAVIEESVASLNRRKEEVHQDHLVTNISEPTEEVQRFFDNLQRAE